MALSMSRLSKKFYVPRCEVGVGPFGWEVLTGQFLIARFPPKWLDEMVLVTEDGTVSGRALGWPRRKPEVKDPAFYRPPNIQIPPGI